MSTSSVSTPETHQLRTTDHIEFFFDPLCPWAWITSRFMVEVAEHRPLDVTWRLVSLAILNIDDDGNPPAPPYDRVIPIGTQNMRVLAAVAKDHDNAQFGALYTAIGERLHPGGRSSELFGDVATEGAHLGILAEALEEVGLPRNLIEVAADESLDQLVRAETAEALTRTGEDVGTPIITYDLDDPEGSSYFGPVFNRIPRGAEAVALFGAVAGLALTDGLAEMKRSNRGEPDFT
jgi:hypothetical protein